MFDDRSQEQPPWLVALSGLFTPDPDTGWMDSDAALDAMAWLGEQVFTQSQTDRGFHTRESLQHQVEATAQVTNTLTAIQATRIAQFCATSVDYAVIRKTGTHGGSGSTDASGGDGRANTDGVPNTGDGDRTETRWVGETAHGPVAALQGVPAGPGVRPGQTREVWHPLGFKADYADTELGAGLCLGPGAASHRVEDAIDAVTKTPRLLAQVGAGRFDAYRLAQVTRELVEAGDATCARVEDELLTRGVTGWTARRVQARARTLVRRVDPAAARTIKKKRAKDAINVFTRPGVEDGTTEVQAILWSKDAAAAFAAVDDLATALHRDTTTGKTLGECRADAMVDLILGNTSVTTNLTLLTPIKTTPAAPATSDGAASGGHGAPADTKSTKSTKSAWDARGGVEDEPAEREQAVPDTGSGARGNRSAPVDAATQSAFSRLEADLERQVAETDWDRELIQLVDPPDPPIRVGLGPLGTSRPRPGGLGDQPSTTGTVNDAPAPAPPQPGGEERPPPDDVSGGLDGSGGLGDVELPGIGVIPAETVQGMLHAVGTTITRVLIDQDTGTLVSASARTYRPTAAIRRFVAWRDLHCRFPTCGREAKYCDVDHVDPWPEGETTPANLQLLCRHHHRAKHEGGWQVTMTPDGICDWTSSTGRTYTTLPGLTDLTTDLTLTTGPSAP